MNDKLILYHYSNNIIKGKIKPSFFGDNHFTFNDLKASKVKRAFFYLDNTDIEYRFKNCKNLYACNIDKKKVYDLNVDNKKLKARFNSIDDLLRYVKSHYKGVCYNVGNLKICNVFIPLKIDKAILK